MIDDLDKKIIRLIQGDIPVDPRPFAVLAEKAGITEDEFLARLKNLIEDDVIRRFGATLYHRSAGIRSNAMAAWCVPEDRIEETGKALAEFKEVTHCYQRQPQKDWRYNLYTMIHGKSDEDCRKIAERMSGKVGIKDYTLLFSKREFKKTSMEYF
ncbi:MAG: AsnC family transcriptional regulator [Deltaproteobacteria bacterium]|nr:AsnC family transcriptional regulator [Deltaproteobacteria bacterium]